MFPSTSLVNASKQWFFPAGLGVLPGFSFFPMSLCQPSLFKSHHFLSRVFQSPPSAQAKLSHIKLSLYFRKSTSSGVLILGCIDIQKNQRISIWSQTQNIKGSQFMFFKLYSLGMIAHAELLCSEL